jgi:hypothetical protein
MQTDFAELKDIEIFASGVHRGRTYTDADLDTIVANFGSLKDEIKPVAVIGHEEDQDLLKNSGLFSAGWMTDVKKSGSKLVASFKDVPQVLAELINKGAYRRISSEIYDNYKGKGNALRRVAILGGEIPEVKNLQDIAALYSEAGVQEKTTWVPLTEAAPQSKEDNMDDVKKMQEDVTKLSEQVAALSEANAKLAAEKETAVTKLTEIETEKKREDIKRFCDDSVKEGKLSPALRGLGLEKFMEKLDDSTVARFAEGDKAVEVSSLGFMKAFLAAIPKNAIVKLGEMGGTGDDQNADRSDKTAAEKLSEATTKLMSAANAVGKTMLYAEAFEQAQKANPERAKEYADEIGKKQ